MKFWRWFRARDDVMSAVWLKRERETTRVEFHGPRLTQWPIRKAANERGWRNRVILRKRA